MCINSEDSKSPCSSLKFSYYRRPWKRPNNNKNKLRVRRLNRRNNKEKMELKNLKLYRENQSIMRENEKLRKKALVLHQENQALLSHLKKLTAESSPS